VKLQQTFARNEYFSANVAGDADMARAGDPRALVTRALRTLRWRRDAGAAEHRRAPHRFSKPLRTDTGDTVLKNLDPLLNADVLHALASMGHGDEVVICDANFPADSVARETALGRVLRLDGVDAPRAVRAVLSVLPLDSFVDDPALRMEVVGDPRALPAVQREAQQEVNAGEGREVPFAPLERFAFYERARRAYCVIATGEPRGYGCFVFKKGVLLAADEPRA
jgi:L-fucose mutarotase